MLTCGFFGQSVPSWHYRIFSVKNIVTTYRIVGPFDAWDILDLGRFNARDIFRLGTFWGLGHFEDKNIRYLGCFEVGTFWDLVRLVAGKFGFGMFYSWVGGLGCFEAWDVFRPPTWFQRTIWYEWTRSEHSPLACSKISLECLLGQLTYSIYCARSSGPGSQCHPN